MAAPGDTLPQRFQALWRSLTPVGRDPHSGGYLRFAWTPADLAMRQWFAEQAAQRGMTLRRDRNGNCWAWWGEPAAGAVVTGSHLDSVPHGGAYDGPLGVVAAFLAVDELREAGVRPQRPIAVVAFSDEEGARFGVACTGSRLLTGALAPEKARELLDSDGWSLAAVLQDLGVDPDGLGRDDEALSHLGAFVELHIEQGRGLVDLEAPVGLASAIWPHGRWRFGFDGEADHAGTTRLVDRHDPMPAFAATVLAARTLADEAGAVATIGRALIVPNGTNAIAASVTAWLDARAADEATVDELVAAVTEQAHRAGQTYRTPVTVSQGSYSPAVVFDATLRARLDGVLGGVPAVATAAGHDAGILSTHVPTAMLFVRNPTGTSHSPAEHATDADCVAGIRALAAVLAELSSR